MPTWEVDLFVHGPITVKGRLRLNEPKGRHLDEPFYSDIELRSATSGVTATVSACAPSGFVLFRTGP